MTGRRVARAAVMAVLALAPAAAPAQAQGPPPSLDGAAAAILVDARDGTPLLARQARRPRAVASTTKLMTALLTLERADLDDVFTAPPYDALPIESKIDLATGERMVVRDLLRALLLESANDAAVALAVGIAGSQEAFVELMNERAAELGLRRTSYANPIGLDDADNRSTARDLAQLARTLLADPRFARIVDLPSATLESGARPRTVDNRNDLIAQYPFVDGVKTGYTDEAGYVLVGSATAPNGAKVVSVVLGEPSEAARDAESVALLRYGLAQYRRVAALRAGRTVATTDVAYRDERARLVPARDVGVLARRGQRVRTRVDAPDELDGELAAGARVGTAIVVRDGEPVRRVALLTARAVPGAGLPRRVVAVLGVPSTILLALILAGGSAIVGSRVAQRRRTRLRRTRRKPRAEEREGAAAGPAPRP